MPAPTSAARRFCCPCLLIVARRFYSISTTALNHKPSKRGQGFDSLLVLDFEATCDNSRTLKPQVRANFYTLSGADVEISSPLKCQYD